MTPVGMRTLLRRRLDDTAKADFTDDSDLDEILNDAIEWTQARLLMVEPDHNSDFEVVNVISGQDIYQIPLAAKSLRTLEYLDPSSSPARYFFFNPPVDEMSFRNHNPGDDPTSDTTTRLWVRLGQSVRITPIPASNLTAGLRFGFVARASMDTLERLPTELHQAAVLRAEQLLQPELQKADTTFLTELVKGEVETIASIRKTVGDTVPMSSRASVNR